MRRRLQDVVGATQLGVLTLQPLQLGQLIGGRPRTSTLVGLDPAHPQAHRLSMWAQLLSDRADRLPLRPVLVLMIEHQPDRTLAKLVWIWRMVWHNPFSSRTGVSTKPGALPIYQITKCDLAAEFVDQLTGDLRDDSMPEEVRSLGRTIATWRDQIVAWHRARVSNGPNEAINNLVKRIKRIAFGITNFRNYRIRALLYAGKPNWGLLATLAPRENAKCRIHRVCCPGGRWQQGESKCDAHSQ